MKKTELLALANVISASLAKLGKNKDVTTDVYAKK